MNKYKLLAVMSIGIFLAGCKSLQEASNKPIESYQSSIKEESSANELSDSSVMRTIDSNEGKLMVTEKVEVLLPPALENKELTTDSDKELLSKIQAEFTNKDIEIYQNSLSFLSGYTYYSNDTGEIVLSGILVNDTSSTINEISGIIGKIFLENYPDVQVGNGNFTLQEKDYGYLKPKQAVTIVVTAPIMMTGKRMPNKDVVLSEKEISALSYGFEYRVIKDEQ